MGKKTISNTFTVNTIENLVDYKLLPSHANINVGRTSNGGYNPATVSLTCGYKKIDGDTITVVEDAIYKFDGVYNVYFRRRLRSTKQYESDYITYSGYLNPQHSNTSSKALLQNLDVATYDAVEFYISSDSSQVQYNGRYFYKSNITPIESSETVLIVANGENGDTVKEVSIYKWTDEKPTKPTSTSIPPAGWSLNTDKPECLSVGKHWVLDGVDDSAKLVVRIPFTTTKANASFTLRAVAHSEMDCDYVIIGHLDNDSMETDDAVAINEACQGVDSIYYGYSKSGNGESITHQYTVATAGEHFICIAYVKDSSVGEFGDYGEVYCDSVDGVDTLLHLWRCNGTVCNDDTSITGEWTSPVQMNAIDGESGDTSQQIFYRNPNNQAPETPATSQSDAVPSGWSATPQGVSSVYRYEWVSMRIKSGGVWGVYSTPAIYAYYAEDGTSISIKGAAIEMAQGTWPDILYPYEQDLSTTSIGDVILFDETHDPQAGAQKIKRVLPFIEDEEEKHFVVEAVNVGDGYLIVSKDGQASDEGHLYMATDYDDSGSEYFFWQDCGRIKGEKGDDGVSFFMTSSANSVKIAANERTAPFTGTFSLFKKIGEGEPVAYEACYSAYRRKGNTYALLSSTNMKSATYQVVTTADMSYDAIVVFAFNSQYAGASPHTQNYVAKSEVLIAKDADLTQPNILKRTIFDYGLDAIKDAWSASATSGTSWQCISIPTNTPDTDVQGRLSVRINASLLTSPQVGNFVDFAQNVYGRLKPSTWYTLSFYSFSTHQFSTFLWSGTGSYVIDYNAGWYIDGVYSSGSSSIGGDGQVNWPADWTGKRHTITFKTVSSFPTQNFIIIFRTYYISTEQDRAQTAICMPKLELGQVATEYVPDEKDQRGKIGRFFYYGGVFDSSNNTKQFVVNDAQTPYFEHQADGQKRYHVFNPDESPASGQMTMTEMWAIGNDWNEKPWEVMTNDFKYLITEAIFATFAKLGSWIFNGDFMLSQYGTDGTGNYQNFDPQNPTSWTPNTLFNAFDGSGWLAGRRIEWDANGDLQMAGLVRKKKTVITVSNISQYMTIVDTIYDSTTGHEVYVYMLNLAKAGNWVELNGLNRIGIKLPSIKHDVHYASEDVKDEARSLLGSSAILNLVSSTNIFFARTNMRIYYDSSNSQGRRYVDCDPETPALNNLGNNNIVYLDCIDGEYKDPSTGYYTEDIKWIAKEYDKTSLANT